MENKTVIVRVKLGDSEYYKDRVKEGMECLNNAGCPFFYYMSSVYDFDLLDNHMSIRPNLEMSPIFKEQIDKGLLKVEDAIFPYISCSFNADYDGAYPPIMIESGLKFLRKIAIEMEHTLRNIAPKPGENLSVRGNITITTDGVEESIDFTNIGQLLTSLNELEASLPNLAAEVKQTAKPRRLGF